MDKPPDEAAEDHRAANSGQYDAPGSSASRQGSSHQVRILKTAPPTKATKPRAIPHTHMIGPFARKLSLPSASKLILEDEQTQRKRERC